MSQQAESIAAPIELRRKAQQFLFDVVRERDGMFPYSTRVADGKYVNDFEHPAAARYSINSLLGLQAVASSEPGEIDTAAVASLTAAFLDHRAADVTNPADLGLLLVLLAEGELSRSRALGSLGEIRGLVGSGAVQRLTMQENSWMLWGACAAARAGIGGAADVAVDLGEVILRRFVDGSSGIPRHSLARYRRGVVSFGAAVYFLRAQHELASATGDERAAAAFARGVDAIVRTQGALGEWPWLIDVGRGVPLDFYPVFAVHQDSMSMLFLLPALERGSDVSKAIDASLEWVCGRNELSTRMIEDDPFVAYRSIERSENVPRLRRYLRATARSVARGSDRSGSGRRVRLNRECRSYHLGWILYAWSGGGRGGLAASAS
jgi:hypothetical protein